MSSLLFGFFSFTFSKYILWHAFSRSFLSTQLDLASFFWWNFFTGRAELLKKVEGTKCLVGYCLYYSANSLDFCWVRLTYIDPSKGYPDYASDILIKFYNFKDFRLNIATEKAHEGRLCFRATIAKLGHWHSHFSARAKPQGDFLF